MFTLTKRIRGKPRHYLYEAYRDAAGVPRRRLVAYLGEHRTPEERFNHFWCLLPKLRWKAAYFATQARYMGRYRGLRWAEDYRRKAAVNAGAVQRAEKIIARLRPLL